MIIYIKFNTPMTENKSIRNETEGIQESMIRPPIVLIGKGKVAIIPIQIHINISRFSSQRDLKKPRIIENRNFIRIYGFNPQIWINFHSRSTQTSEETRAKGRSKVNPNIEIAIFLFQDVHPNSLLRVKKIENIFGH